MTVAAIVLAAGASLRLGQPKQLLIHGGQTLLERAIRLADEAGASPVLTVLGAHFEVICASIQFADSITVFNDKWQQGIASSIHAGLHALDVLSPSASGALLLSCDQPRLSAGHLHTLMLSFSTRAEPTIVASTYAGIRGVPAIFPRSVFQELLALRGDRGARALLVDPPCPLIAIEFQGGEIDIDLPADLGELE